MLAAMKLTEGRGATANIIRSYGPEGLTIGADRHALPLLLTATQVDSALEGRSLASLTDGDRARVLSHEPALVLVGGASGVERVPPALRALLEGRRIAIESMQLGAACRTFNVLVQEDRAVLGLFLP
jgi:uncharacterized protein